MNFCGGGVEQQVHEPPIVSMMRHHSIDDDLPAENSQYPHSIDLPVHPTCMVPSSQPQNTPTNQKSNSGFVKKKKPTSSITSSFHPQDDNSRTPPPRSRSRSRSRGRGRRRRSSVQDDNSEISTPLRLSSNLSTKSSPSPRMLNPITPQRLVVATAGAAGQENGADGLLKLNSFANMKTLDTLLKRLENGFRVTIHDGSDPSGKRVFLTLLQNRTSLLIRPVEGEEKGTPSVKFPVKTILRLEIGKTKSSVLGRSIYDHIHPMTCFSIVVKLWTDSETYFDFEASSVIEREALISTLMVVLDQMHNNSGPSSPKVAVPSPGGSAGGPAWLHPRKGQSPASAMHLREVQSPTQPDVCLSPGRRTKIYSSKFFEDGEEQQGTEIGLVSPPRSRDEEGGFSYSPMANNQSKPLRQRQLQPAVDNSVQPLSPPRTPRLGLRHARNFLGVSKNQSAEVNKNSAPLNASKSPDQSQSPLEVVVIDRRTDEQRDSPEDGGFEILSSNQHQDHPETPDAGLRADLSFEIASQSGLPVSKIHFSPTREDGGQNQCCGLVPNNVDQTSCSAGNCNPNGQVAWCSDDICTSALKDIAETCTGIFDHDHESLRNKDAAERAYVEEYIAGVLGGPTSALGAFFPDGDVWNANSSKQNKIKPNRIKNRASVANAQATRLRTLRNEMTFAAALKRSKERMQFVQTTKSFDDADAERLRRAQMRSVNKSALMGRMVGGMAVAKQEAENDAVYYDSDPEDVRPRTKGVRRAVANRCNTVEAQDEHKQTRPVLSGVGFEKIAVGKKLRKLDEGLIIQIVQAMRNETLTLMWHPTQTEGYPNRSPICVNLWIESGVYLVDGSFLLPRLSWSVAYENNLDAKKLNVSKTEPDQIDLLDVCRIRITETINRNLHPFADPRKSFVIETQDEIYCFEAQNTDERNRIVYGYKLVIARLASLLMLRDSRAVEEFFGSANAMVPGGFTVGK